MSLFKCSLLLFLMTGFLKPVLAQETPHLEPFIALDFVLPVQFQGSENNRLYLRSAEIVFDTQLSAKLRGHLNFSFHDEEGETLSDVHEAFVEYSELVPNLDIKIGKFLLGVGILNTVHQHDWNFTSTPKVHNDFFSQESVSDTGIEATYTLPTTIGWELKVGSTNGYNYGHSHEAGEKPKSPTSYVHMTNFLDVGTDGLLQTGLNYLHREDHESRKFELFGIDLQWQSDRSPKPTYHVSSEIWFRKNNFKNHYELDPHDHSDPAHEHEHEGEGEDHAHSHEQHDSHLNFDEQIGLYLYSEYRLNDSHALGLRIDYFKYLNAHDADNVAVSNSEISVHPSYIYYMNDQSLIRATYSYYQHRNSADGDHDHQAITLQWVALFGGHNHQH